MKLARTVAGVLTLILTLDLLVILVTESGSPLMPHGAGVGLWGFGLRAVALGLSMLLRFRILAERRRRMQSGLLLLLLLLLPTLLQFQYAGGRVNGDGIMYYVQVRSLLKDGDFDFANEYTHYGLITRGDLSMQTSTGLRRSIFAVGPAVLWSPFFALGEGVGRIQAALGGEVDLRGYGPCHRNAVALGSLMYGFGIVLLTHSLLLRHFRESTALGAALLVWGTTFLQWYMVQQPTMAHATSGFMAALAVWLWDRSRGRREVWGFFVLGLTLGLAMCTRWQNGVFLVLPGIELLSRVRRDPRWLPEAAASAGCLAVGVVIGAFPQMAAWKAIYDSWILLYPPHGVGFVRLDHPYLLQTLFSSRHGLLSWTPIFWAGFLGFLPLLRRRRQLALPLLIPLGIMTYVNACSGDWWAGASFSIRRFDSLLSIFALGFAGSIDVLRALLSRRPGWALVVAGLPFLVWNLALAEQVRRNIVPRDDTTWFPRLVGNGARVVADIAGSPTTWPGSWLFAWQQDRPPSQYDLLVGRYLFYRQNNLEGHVEIGAPGDEAMLGEGWGPAEVEARVTWRRLKSAGRIFAPLDVPEELEIRLRAASTTPEVDVHVRVNGREAGQVRLTETWTAPSLRVAADFWRRELNDVVLEAPAGFDVRVDAVDFSRVGRQ